MFDYQFGMDLMFVITCGMTLYSGVADIAMFCLFPRVSNINEPATRFPSSS